MKLLGRQKNTSALRQPSKLARFGKSEDGSMVIFTLFVLTLMLVVGGMAVDFMRFESRRAMMQGALDSAVLAAADLDQARQPAAVVIDHLNKSQVGNCLAGAPDVTPGSNYRKVSATCSISLDTFFLRLIGMDNMQANATSTAIEGVGNIEVSLVLDISGSMANSIPGTSTTRIAKMREAGVAFVDALLQEEYEDKVSLSVVPYTEDVNIGPELYETILTTGHAGNEASEHGYSHCIAFPASAFSSTAWNNSTTYRQVPHFQWNASYNQWGGQTNDVNNPICPQQVFERVVPLSQDRDMLANRINQLQPRAGTSIFLGLKWAVTLLDPSFNTNIRALPGSMIDEAFEDRPDDYGTIDNPSNTLKYVVLMTDGQNWASNRLKTSVYNDENDVAHWANFNWYHFYNNHAGGSSMISDSFFVDKNFYTGTLGDTYMQAMCTAAKNQGIIIFTIAMGSTTNGKVQMSNCASSTGHYFETSGSELVQIFEAIAEQITDLRLVQ